MLGYHFGQPVMMQLGAFQFGIATAAYQELRRTAAWRWPTQERFGKAATMQFTGPETETMDLPGVIYPEWRGGFGQLDTMRSIAGEGKPLALVAGDGASMGKWVILRVEETQTVFGDAGAPRRVEFSLALQRYPEDDAEQQQPASAAAAATATVPDDASTPAAKVQGLSGSLSGAAASLSSALTSAADQVQQHVAPLTGLAADALGGVQRAAYVAGELKTLADRTLAMVGASPIDSTALNGAQHLAATAAGLIVSADSASALLRRTGENLAQVPGVTAAATKAMQSAQVAANSTVSLASQTAAQAATIKG